jgi:hypothetical protein
VLYRYEGLEFIWDVRKAASNLYKHGIRFEQACEVFLDPLAQIVAAGGAAMKPEIRSSESPTVSTSSSFPTSSVSRQPFASSQPDPLRRQKGEPMKTMRERLKVRLQPGRPMTTISLRMPEDVISDLKEIAPMLGFTGYQPLMRSYIGQGLRKDLSRLDGSQVEVFTASLRKQGVLDEQISMAIAEAGLKTA